MTTKEYRQLMDSVSYRLDNVQAVSGKDVDEMREAVKRAKGEST